MITSVIAWIVLGLIAGYIASKLVHDRGEGLPFEILLGIVGAVIGGWIFNAIGSGGVTRFNVWSLLVAIAGATMLLVVWHAFRRSICRAANAQR